MAATEIEGPCFVIWTREKMSVPFDPFDQVRISIVAALIGVLGGYYAAQVAGAQSMGDDVLRLSDAGQLAFTKSVLDSGLPGEQSSALTALVLNRGELVIPVISKKIEEVLLCKDARGCFTHTGVDPQKFVGMAAAAIAYAGSETALREIGRLLELDNQRFDRLPTVVLSAASGKQNQFSLAYRAMDMGSAKLTGAVVRWAVGRLEDPDPDDSPLRSRRQWAEALVDRYGAIPSQSQWDVDPLVAGLPSRLGASLRYDLFRLMAVAWKKRTLPDRMAALPPSEQALFAKTQLDSGIPDNAREELVALAHRNGSLILPIIGKKVEEVLKSQNQMECFTDRSVDPKRFLYSAVEIIADASDRPAMAEAARLIKYKTFQALPEAILARAERRGNPFPVVYAALEVGDADLTQRILAWVERALSTPALNIPKDYRHQWAETMVDRYSGSPDSAQWNTDPIIARLKSGLAASIRPQLSTLAYEAGQRRLRR